MGYLEQQKEKIINTYRAKKSIREIASILNCSSSGIKRILNKYNIPARNKCESLNLCPEKFSEEEHEFILGSVLGDAHIVKPKSENSESHFYIGHSIKQKEYIQYKYQILSRFIGCKIYKLKHKLTNNKEYTTLNFVTRKSPLFTRIRKSFYRDSLKIVPFNIIETHLTPFLFSFFYMDDGYNIPGKGCEICSQSFTKFENEKLCEIINNKFNLNFHLIRVKSGNGYKIAVFKKHKKDFFNIIKKHVIKSMAYKLL